MPFKFEKLTVWKLAIELASDIHELTRSFVLTSQMKRASDSISLNIAEGSTGQSDPEQVKFLGYAQRSALEVINCFYLALSRKYITEILFNEFYKRLETLIIKIQALKKTLKN